ncbi:hypothetical protein FYJ24_11200 [Actinomycetaceae bacterium WB03_NA08]|uniref:Type I restriction modification DNA specificity domain-containing protein n=1 Tax=Scrofimicrobium canadense TaxID=2652290 RepID=A0A6N7VU62_9ACTO|nr:restriction endonuclease subunit S [Scrofimicrobium canadense]MSS85309.1 hypothetical protein [Scrofimicrobium canadense]
MIADRLRAAILQAAISGKLTDQRPEDGTATELLEQIAAERDALVKAKKRKKQKPLPPITDEDRPFPIPSNWEWARFGDLVIDHIGGGTPSKNVPAYWNGNIPWASVKDLKGRYLVKTTDRISIEGVDHSSTNVVPEGSLIVCMRMAVGKAVMTLIETAINQDLRAFELYRLIDNEFFLYWYESQEITGSGVTVKGITVDFLLKHPFALPPLAEQERIVAKLDEVLPLIDQLAELEREREHLDREFAKAIERAILQAAISGKLTKQHPEDGTADELLETIRSERQQLEKEGKIKKQKPLPPVDKTDEPFALPGSWAWSRLGHVFNMQAGKNVAVGDISEVGEYPCYGGNGLRGYVADYNRDGTYPLIGRQGALCGNINVASGRFFATEHAVVVETFGRTSPTWAALALEQLNLNQYATATAQPGLSVEKLKVVPVPLPPVGEQERIAAKLNRALPLAREIGGLVS